ncbi:MAG: NADH:flavin oxidoreductase/NADH oxidase, partial [Ktedonobacterales bacterium]|nr:NADH:flavin oxidoreductase/NADH oxidase [Ktedonobacterales bacterium]
ATDWHLVHLGGFAVGGAAGVMTEATAVEARGRITPGDLGIWDDAHLPMLRRITDFIRAQGAVPAIQLAHAGRKASTLRPWSGHGVADAAAGGWQDEVIGPSALAFAPNYPMPQAMTRVDIAAVIDAFRQAARRSHTAGFEIIELHGAHGYLFHEFLSPAANQRDDEYGGTLANRARFLLEAVAAVQAEWPATLPLFVRLSATDWLPAGAGFSVDDCVQVAAWLRAAGVDVIDVSSGGLDAQQRVAVGPGYQVPFAARVRHESAIPVAAVGLITEPAQAEAILRDGQVDLIALARELLRDPHWPLRAARELGADIAWPKQYERAKL